MTLRQSWDRIVRTLGTGVFPHQASRLLELSWRKSILSPETLAARMPVSAGARALEIGAGSGVYSVAVARRMDPTRIVLLDLQPEMLTKAREQFRSHRAEPVPCVAADGTNLPFADGLFDVIYMVTVLGEVRDPHRLLAEIRRVLAPRGVLSISEHLPDPDFTPPARMAALVERAGFRLVARQGRWWSYTMSFSAER